MKKDKISKDQNIHSTSAGVFNQENADMGNKYIDQDINPSSYRVMVVTMFYKYGDCFKIMNMIVDRNALELAMEVCQGICAEHPGQTWKTHQHLKSLIYKEGVPSNYFGMVVMNFLGCFAEPYRVCMTMPEQSLGFNIHFDVDDYNKCNVLGKTFQEIEMDLNKMLSKG